MTDEKDKAGQRGVPLQPFPVHRPESPFPPLYESVTAAPEVAPEPVPADPPSDWNRSADAHDLPTRVAALGRFAFPPAPPLDDEGVAARDRRWTSRMMLTAVVFLLVFNAVSPLNWARRQPPGWLPQTVESLSGVWVEQLAVFGADQPRQGLHDLWQTARDARFIGQPPAPGTGSTAGGEA